ncbi:MAG: AAA family ATPase [Gammaproteobacteria bacterium]|jgi:predicted AAA+ superfamily ATPase
MLNRIVLDKLRQWKNNSNRKPLILRGARQVGKTTAVTMFATEFDDYIYLNLENIEDQKIFNSNYTFDEILAAIFFYKKTERNKKKKTLIFIDEIQNSSTAVSMMRYFYEKANELFVITAGSLLETLIETQINFPVGRVEYMFMYPFTFYEFLQAMNETEILEILEKFSIPDLAHDKILNLFHKYTLLGGMPEIIQHYRKTKDIVSLNNIYQSLMLGYMNDIEKYTKNARSANIIRHAIEHAPLEAGKRIKFQGFGQSNYGSKEMGEALKTIEKALLIHLIYPITNITPPMLPNYKKSPKLQFLDTGLINYIAGLQKYYFELNDLNSFYRGLIAEHIVGQELIAHNLMPMGKLYFWIREKKQSTAEIDFVVQYNNHIIPIEVKSGKSGTLKSIHQFIDATNHNFAIRLYAGKIRLEKTKTTRGKEFYLLNLPYYLTFQLEHYVKKYFQENL